MRHPLRHITPTVILLAGMTVLVLLALFDPTEVASPKCLFKFATGWDCPGCGSQRAIHALLHGDVAGAWHFNPALFFAVGLCVAMMWRPVRRFSEKPAFGTIVAISIIVWWIGRNL